MQWTWGPQVISAPPFSLLLPASRSSSETPHPRLLGLLLLRWAQPTRAQRPWADTARPPRAKTRKPRHKPACRRVGVVQAGAPAGVADTPSELSQWSWRPQYLQQRWPVGPLCRFTDCTRVPLTAQRASGCPHGPVEGKLTHLPSKSCRHTNKAKPFLLWEEVKKALGYMAGPSVICPSPGSAGPWDFGTVEDSHLSAKGWRQFRSGRSLAAVQDA